MRVKRVRAQKMGDTGKRERSGVWAPLSTQPNPQEDSRKISCKCEITKTPFTLQNL